MISLRLNSALNFINLGNGTTSLRSRMPGFFLFIICLLANPMAEAAELTAEVDRQTIIDGEAVVLYIKGTDIPNLPDTSSLNANFRIIQSGQSTSQTIVNGKSSRTVTVRLELQPKSLGSSVIPAFTVGSVSSDPITIEVVARGTPGVEPRDKVFAELSVDNPNPYVQEQVILSLKIFDDGNLASADPVLEGNSDYQIEKLPLDREKIVNRNGVQYRVNTFRYALFPQQSGEILIEEVTIPASIRDNSYSGSLILFNTPTRRIELKSDSIALSVKSRAVASTAGWWLPVKSHEVKHEWSGDITDVKVGEPLTLTLETVATGATSTQLPEIPVPDVQGLKIYVDNPEFGSRPDATGLLSVRRDKWSVIPNQAGQLTLPEVVIKWWDTEADVERRSVIPAQQLVVAGGSADSEGSADSQGAVAISPTDAKIPTSGQNDSSTPVNSGDASNSQINASSEARDNAETVNALSARSVGSEQFVSKHWLWVAVAAVTAWLATLLAWWWSSRKRRSKDSTTVKPADNSSERKAFKKMKTLAAATETDSSAYSSAVLEWAQSRWPSHKVHNLPDVGMRLNNRVLADNMRQLDQQRFSSSQSVTSTAVSIYEIQKSLEEALQHESADKPLQDRHALPQL